ncbi:acyl-CoA dehydrogenase family protein [Castellaniella sp.]|uniref:acyl-CoA dehydrogenase family protein n=1 Tax=Castellaniella sp. TaxID=1955812 RepID=UPI002AFFA51A|nr:acyl-CoA dehydrogenase family protein [Castellaniella sp.]
MTSPNPMLDRIRAILPDIAARADQAEKERQVPAENIRLLKQTGMHRAFQPRHYGGLEMSLPDFAQCVVALSGACGGTSWAFSLLCTHSHQLAMFSKQLQDEVWGQNPDATASSSIAPFGRTEEVEGGILFSGEMGWSSGCDHADWAIVGFNRFDANGEKVYCFAVVPRQDYTIRDDWYAMGMRGSGSKTLILDKVFVPEHRIQAAKGMMEGQSAGFRSVSRQPDFLYPISPVFRQRLCRHQPGRGRAHARGFQRKDPQSRARLHRGQRWPGHPSLDAFG